MNPDVDHGDYISEPVSYSSLPDRRLLRNLVAGDELALAALYNRYSESIFNYVLRLVKDLTAAEDILQDAFLAVWRGADRFRHHSSVKTWMFRIAHNQAVSWIRRNKSIELGSQFEPGDEEGLEANLVSAWRAEEVRSALDQLSPIHRATVELAFVHELSYKEIGEVFDCPVGTVKSRMSHAIRHLSRILKARGMGER